MVTVVVTTPDWAIPYCRSTLPAHTTHRLRVSPLQLVVLRLFGCAINPWTEQHG